MLWQLLVDSALLALSQARHLLLRLQCDAQVHWTAASYASGVLVEAEAREVSTSPCSGKAWVNSSGASRG